MNHAGAFKRAVPAVTEKGDRSMRYVSIMGDSISTYEGYVPEGYAVYYDSWTRTRNGLTSVYDTWWAKVNQALKAYLCVDNAFSGSRVTGDAFPAASCEQRTGALHTAAAVPDIILVYIGFNDFGDGVPIRAPGLKGLFRKDPNSFEAAYTKMLKQIKRAYPYAKIVCGTLMRSTVAGYDTWTFPERFCGVPYEDYSHAIRRACKREKCYLADLSALGLRYETLDGTHPTKNGHHTLFLAWERCLTQLGLI